MGGCAAYAVGCAAYADGCAAYAAGCAAYVRQSNNTAISSSISVEFEVEAELGNVNQNLQALTIRMY